MKEPIKVVVKQQKIAVQVKVSSQAGSSDVAVSQLRSELGDFKADLLLNYNISKL